MTVPDRIKAMGVDHLSQLFMPKGFDKMPKLDLKLCAELLELDGKRTPGDWVNDLATFADPDDISLWAAGGSFVANLATEHLVAFDAKKEDAAFIAAAPKLAEQLKAALEERGRLRKALDQIATCDIDRPLTMSRESYMDHIQRAMRIIAKQVLSETEATR